MMTVTQAERLVRKITEVIGQPVSDTQVAKLAQEYADLCRAANRRLEQCALMIEAGQALHALQLAETPPPLLDMVTVLGFRQAAEWRSYCQAHHLPWSEPFYDKFVRQVNSAYGQGIASDHPYYRDYRRAVLKNDDDRALSILRVIARMNPADENTRQELKRVEEKLLRGKLEKLREVAAAGNSAATQEQLEQIEAAGGPLPSSHPVWQQAQVTRCQALLKRAGEFREQDAWQDAEALVEEIHDVATRNNIHLPAADADAWSSLEEWTTERRNAFADDKDFQRAVAALDYEIKTIETRRSKGGGLRATEAQNGFNSLTAKFLEAKRFNRPLEDSLTARRQRAQFWLEEQIKAAKLKRTLFTAAVIVVFLIIIGATLSLALNSNNARNIARRLSDLEASRQVSATEDLIAKVPENLQTKPNIKGALASAQDFVAREKSLQQTFDQAISLLNQWAAGGFNGNLNQAPTRRAQAEQALSQLAPEFQSTAQPALSAWDAKWQAFRNAQLNTQLARAEQIAGGLDGASGFASVQAALPKIQSILTEVAPLRIEPPALDPLLQSRLRQLNDQTSQWASRASQWEQSQAALLGAQTLDEYLTRLGQMVQSPFASTAQRDGAAEIDRLKLSEASLLGELLLPDDHGAWDTLTNSSAWGTTFMPVQPTTAEKSAYFVLRDDKNMQNVYIYELVTNARPNNSYHTHKVYVQGVLSRARDGDTAGAVFDPDEFRDSAHFLPISYSDYDYKYIIKTNQIPECETFERVGLSDLIDASTGNYQKPILQLIDQLNRADTSSALFRAVAILELYTLADFRRDEWGFQWCPSAERERRSLEDLGGADLKSGDWMAGAPKAKYEATFQNYFDQARLVPLEKEAEFLQRLAQQTCQADFAYAGFIDITGRPVLRDNNALAQEYWGWGGAAQSVVLVFRKSNGGASLDKLAEPLPFTPLFVFNGDRRALLTDTTRAVAFPPNQFNGILPPFFAGLHE